MLTWFLALFALLLTGPPVPTTDPSPTLAFATWPGVPPGEWRTAFSASLDNVVYMRAQWAHVKGAHTAAYHVYSPDGALWQDIAVPFTGPGDTWAALPIAGTAMGRLLGTWHVTLTLDADPTVRTQAPFELTE